MKRLKRTVRGTALPLLMLCLILLGAGCSKKQYTLTIAVEGEGTTLPKPGQHNYEQDTFVQLQTISDKYSVFDHWAGRDADSVTTDNKIFMHSDKSITAVFTTLNHPLNININPVMSGHVQVDLVTDAGKIGFPHGQTARLTAIPNQAGTYFVKWSGDLSGPDNPVELLITSDKNITAHFAKAALEVTAGPGVIRAGQAFNVTMTVKAGERPIPNIIINLTENKSQPFQGTKTALTDANGVAVFENLMFYEGNYNLTFSSTNLTSIKKGFTVDVAGAGAPTDPYLIHNLYGLEFIGEHLDACFRIAKDIDASATAATSYNGGKGWLPLGQKSTASFKGQIDGNHKTISNLYIYRPDEEYVGFIGLITTAVQIKNLNLADVDITGYNRVGGLVGEVKDVPTFLADYCSVTGAIKGSIFAGGMFGRLSGTVSNCHTDTTTVAIIINDDSFNLGGFAGSAAGATITHCYAIGNVTGNNKFGGLLGSATDSSINQCYALGDVIRLPRNALNTAIGGFVGYLAYGCQITDCYSRGDVEGREDLGGFCGYLVQSIIERCYSTGSVPVPFADRGGFVGYRSTSVEAVITDCYYDSETSQCSDTGKGEPMTTAEMQNADNYSRWGFGMIWDISPAINDGYPYLRNTPQ